MHALTEGTPPALSRIACERNADLTRRPSPRDCTQVDGGIKADWTISQCAAAGANCFIAGSGMFAYPTLKEGCDELRKVAEEAREGKVLEKPTPEVVAA